jgi:hypothetical protein
MTPIEIFALVFSVAVLLKIIVIFVDARKWIHIAESFFKKPSLLTVLYVVAAVVVGYYLFQSLSIIQITAVMLFTMLLVGMSILAYPGPILKMSKEILKKKDVIKRNWLSLLIWAVIALYTLYILFA